MTAAKIIFGTSLLWVLRGKKRLNIMLIGKTLLLACFSSNLKWR